MPESLRRDYGEHLEVRNISDGFLSVLFVSLKDLDFDPLVLRSPSLNFSLPVINEGAGHNDQALVDKAFDL